MSSAVSVSVLPELLPAEGLAGSVAVVIDVLRASTTMVHALAHGAEAVVPCATVAEALALREQFAAGSVLLGGERKGVLIEGFDLDNSPASYTPERVCGKTIIFTTTNGTKALRACESADRVLIGAFVNRGAVLQSLQSDGRPVHLVCAGTNGRMTAEDILLAGSIADELTRATRPDLGRADVETELAVQFAQSRMQSPARFEQTLRESIGGQNLIRLGYEEDIRTAMKLDLFGFVPEWSPASRSIRRVTSIGDG